MTAHKTAVCKVLDQPLNLTGSLPEIDGQPARDDKTVVVKLSGPIYLNGIRREACLLFSWSTGSRMKRTIHPR